MKEAYKDCEILEEENGCNLLVRYIQENSKDVPAAVAREVAKLSKTNLCDLFPDYSDESSVPSDPPVAHVAAKHKTKPSVSEEEVKDECNNNHEDYSIGTYREEESVHYFKDGGKYSEGQCRVCQRFFPTNHNIEEGLCKKDDSHSIKLPQTGCPAYICKDMFVDNCNCGQMVCNSCFATKLLADSGGRGRRTRRRT